MSVRFSESCSSKHPNHDLPRLPSIREEESLHDLGNNPTRSPSPASYKSVNFSTHIMAPLHSCGPRSKTYHQMVKSERKIAAHAEKSRMDNFARELCNKLANVSRQLSRKKREDEEAKSTLITKLEKLPSPERPSDARELEESCRQTLLFMKIIEGNDSTVSVLPASSTSSFRSRVVNWALRVPTKRPRNSSENSTSTAESKDSNIPNPSDSSTVYSTPNDGDLRQRRISLPLETDLEWLLNGRHFRQESNRADAPVFRVPNYNPEEDEATSCELVHVISNPVDPLDTTHAVNPSSETPVHRLSDSHQPLRKRVFARMGSRDGNEHLAEIQDLDSHGRKKVRLVWGKKIDQIIPHFHRKRRASKVANPTHEDKDGARKRNRWQYLSQKCQGTKKLLEEQAKKIGRKMKSDRVPDDMQRLFPVGYESAVDSIDGVHPGERCIF